VLAAALALWQPVSFLSVAGALPSLPARGWPAALEFVWAASAAFIGAASGWALWMRAPAAVPLARIAIAVAAIRELQRLVWTALPSDVIPGTGSWIAAAVCLAAFILFAMTRTAQISGGGRAF
jgi:hypothetical protein